MYNFTIMDNIVQNPPPLAQEEVKLLDTFGGLPLHDPRPEDSTTQADLVLPVILPPDSEEEIPLTRRKERDASHPRISDGKLEENVVFFKGDADPVRLGHHNLLEINKNLRTLGGNLESEVTAAANASVRPRIPGVLEATVQPGYISRTSLDNISRAGEFVIDLEHIGKKEGSRRSSQGPPSNKIFVPKQSQKGSVQNPPREGPDAGNSQDSSQSKPQLRNRTGKQERKLPSRQENTRSLLAKSIQEDFAKKDGAIDALKAKISELKDKTAAESSDSRLREEAERLDTLLEAEIVARKDAVKKDAADVVDKLRKLNIKWWNFGVYHIWVVLGASFLLSLFFSLLFFSLTYSPEEKPQTVYPQENLRLETQDLESKDFRWSLSLSLILFFWTLFPIFFILFFVFGYHESHHYYFLCFDVPDHLQDRRPDLMALTDLKHKSSKYAVIKYKCNRGLINGLIHKIMMRLRLVQDIDELVISLELFSQLSAATNLAIDSDEKTIWTRINHSSRTLHTVNHDRYKSLLNQAVVQDTAIVVFGLWKQLVAERAWLPFPKTPSMF